MSLYILFGVVLFLCSLFEFLSKRTNKYVYFALFVGLTLMLCFRYGQGTDYFAYHYIYEYVPKTLSLSKLLASSSLHSEIGWKFLCAFSKIIGLDFYTFAAVIGIITMLLLHLFIKKHCPLKITALFIAYPTLYLTYISSGMRQALVICFFLSVLLDLYAKKKYRYFFVLVLLCSLIHTASLILLIMLSASLRKTLVKYQDRLVLASWVVGIFFSIFTIRITFLGRTFSNESSSTSYIAVAERVLTYILLRLVYISYSRRTKEQNQFLDTMMYLYGICLILYGLFFSMPTTSSRICYFFKAVEIVLFTTLMASSRKDVPAAAILFGYIAVLSLVMLYKNIDSYIHQGLYYAAYSNAWTFPYNNLFIKGNYRYSVHQRLLP